MDRDTRRPAAGVPLVGLVLLCGACATTAPRSRTPSPDAIVLDHVPVRSIEDDQCGPGSLSVVLNALGDPVTEAELAEVLPRAPGGGVLSVDLLLAARERGFTAVLTSGDEEALKREIGEGHPAILLLRLLNVPGSGGDIYHYVVVDGHDPRRDLFRMQFGDGEARWAEIDRIAGAWKGAGRAMLTVWRPPSAPTIPGAVELEQAGRLDDAAEQYRQILEDRPGSVRAWVNLGNVEARRGRPREAETAYRRALELSPGDPDASNNLAWLLLEEGSRLEEAEALARGALERAGADRLLVLDTLARIQAARGRCAESKETFETALGLPGLSPASRAQIEDARRETTEACRPG